MNSRDLSWPLTPGAAGADERVLRGVVMNLAPLPGCGLGVDGVSLPCDIYRTFGVQNEQQAVLQLVGAANELASGSLECFRRTFEQHLGDFKDIADLIDQQADSA